jgi:lysine N6-hydroxylase
MAASHSAITGKLVAVVGGGQSGAEVVFHLLRDNERLPMQLMWISSRGNFLPLDDSPFTNELFTPAYSDYFFGLSREQRDLLLGEQGLASDGVSEALLQRIYNRLYELDFFERQDQASDGGGQSANRLARLIPGQEVVDLRPGAPGCELVLRSRWGDPQRVRADIVVLATGFAYDLPEAMRPLSDRLSWDRDGFVVRADFSIVWDGPANLQIYAQDAARHMRGVADPNLSLMAWRSAMIANSLLGKTAYEVEGESSALDFQET